MRFLAKIFVAGYRSLMGVDRTGKPGVSFVATPAAESAPVARETRASPAKEAFVIPDLRRAPRDLPGPMTGAMPAPHASQRPDAAVLKAEQARIVSNKHPQAELAVVSGFVDRVASAIAG